MKTLIVLLISGSFLYWLVKAGYLKIRPEREDKKIKKIPPRRPNGQFKRKVPVYTMYDHQVDYYVWR